MVRAGGRMKGPRNGHSARRGRLGTRRSRKPEASCGARHGCHAALPDYPSHGTVPRSLCQQTLEAVACEAIGVPAVIPPRARLARRAGTQINVHGMILALVPEISLREIPG